MKSTTMTVQIQQPDPTAQTIPLKSTPEINTPEWLRSFPGCEHYSDQEAIEVILALKSLAAILLQSGTKILQPVDNQLVSYLNAEEKTQQLKIAA